MSNNDKIKTSLTGFLIKALPWAIVFVAGGIVGFLIGVK